MARDERRAKWSLESAVGDDGRTVGAGYGVRTRDAFDLSLQASRHETANDDDAEHEFMVRARNRW